MIFVSKMKDKLELELNKYEFQTDIESIKAKECHRRGKNRNIAVILSSLVIVFLVSMTAILSSNSNVDVNTTTPTVNDTSNKHSFFIVASALDSGTEKPMESTVDYAELIDKDIIMIQSMLSCTYYVSGNEKYNGLYDLGDERLEEIFAQDDLTIKKSFSFVGKESMWIEGEDIVKVEYNVNNGCLSKSVDEMSSDAKQIILYNEEISSPEKVIIWKPSYKLLDWVEEQNSHNNPVDFSTIPKDQITITATFSDNSAATRELYLYYNEYGYLVVETEDGTKYNDGKLNDYENWYKKVHLYDGNGNEIIWDYSGRRTE